MNNFEAKRGFLTFVILSLVISIMAYTVNILVKLPTNSTTTASGDILLKTPSQNTFLLVGLPIVIVGIVATIFKETRRKGI